MSLWTIEAQNTGSVFGGAISHLINTILNQIAKKCNLEVYFLKNCNLKMYKKLCFQITCKE
jgi:hypothetical protein